MIRPQTPVVNMSARRLVALGDALFYSSVGNKPARAELARHPLGTTASNPRVEPPIDPFRTRGRGQRLCFCLLSEDPPGKPNGTREFARQCHSLALTKCLPPRLGQFAPVDSNSRDTGTVNPFGYPQTEALRPLEPVWTACKPFQDGSDRRRVAPSPGQSLLLSGRSPGFQGQAGREDASAFA